MSDAQQRSQLDLLRQLNQEHQERHPLEADLAARIQSFELAYRMQIGRSGGAGSATKSRGTCRKCTA